MKTTPGQKQIACLERLARTKSQELTRIKEQQEALERKQRFLTSGPFQERAAALKAIRTELHHVRISLSKKKLSVKCHERSIQIREKQIATLVAKERKLVKEQNVAMQQLQALHATATD